MNHRFARRCAVVVLAAAGLAACSQQTLYSTLGEQEANQQVALLHNAGIHARKAKQDKAFAVTVPGSDFARATHILREHGLPQQDFASRCSIFKREGFVTTALQEHELELCAKREEIAHALSALNGVLEARVVLDSPRRSPLADKPPVPRAAVVLKLRHGVDADELKSKVMRTVVKTLEGLEPNNVSVEHAMADPPPPVAAATTGISFAQGMPWQLALTSGIGLAAIFGALALWWNNRRNSRWATDLGKPASPSDGGDASMTAWASSLSMRSRATGQSATPQTRGGAAAAPRDDGAANAERAVVPGNAAARDGARRSAASSNVPGVTPGISG